MDMITEPRYFIMHLAILTIAFGLIFTLVVELKRPVDRESDESTKRMNDILKD